VIQIDNPLKNVPGAAALGAMAPPTLGYAFLLDPRIQKTRPWYITSLLPGGAFPWHQRDPIKAEDLQCRYLGISIHSGVPLVHIRAGFAWEEQVQENYDQLEKELQEAGYAIIQAKVYDQAAKLASLIQAHVGEKREGAVAAKAEAEAPAETRT
jgi:hypothetical protein